MSPKAEPSRWARRLYVAGVVVGLAVAAVAALGPLKAGPLPKDAVARVEGVVIDRAAYDRAIEALEADKRNPVTNADRKLALDRLIAEELLVRRAQELGLAEDEGSVRKALVDAMVQFAMAQSAGKEPSPADLRRFYDERPDLFAAEPLLRVRAASVPATNADDARTALRASSGFAAAMARVGAGEIAIPDAYLSPAKLADYAGPAASQAALGLQPGEVAGPLVSGDTALFVWLLGRRPGERPPFDAVKTQVADEWRRMAQDRALADYVADLRRRADVDLGPDAPR